MSVQSRAPSSGGMVGDGAGSTAADDGTEQAKHKWKIFRMWHRAAAKFRKICQRLRRRSRKGKESGARDPPGLVPDTCVAPSLSPDPSQAPIIAPEAALDNSDLMEVDEQPRDSSVTEASGRPTSSVAEASVSAGPTVVPDGQESETGDRMQGIQTDETTDSMEIDQEDGHRTSNEDDANQGPDGFHGHTLPDDLLNGISDNSPFDHIQRPPLPNSATSGSSHNQNAIGGRIWGIESRHHEQWVAERMGHPRHSPPRSDSGGTDESNASPSMQGSTRPVSTATSHPLSPQISRDQNPAAGNHSHLNVVMTNGHLTDEEDEEEAITPRGGQNGGQEFVAFR